MTSGLIVSLRSFVDGLWEGSLKSWLQLTLVLLTDALLALIVSYIMGAYCSVRNRVMFTSDVEAGFELRNRRKQTTKVVHVPVLPPPKTFPDSPVARPLDKFRDALWNGLLECGHAIMIDYNQPKDMPIPVRIGLGNRDRFSLTLVNQDDFPYVERTTSWIVYTRGATGESFIQSKFYLNHFEMIFVTVFGQNRKVYDFFYRHDTEPLRLITQNEPVEQLFYNYLDAPVTGKNADNKNVRYNTASYFVHTSTHYLFGEDNGASNRVRYALKGLMEPMIYANKAMLFGLYGSARFNDRVTIENVTKFARRGYPNFPLGKCLFDQIQERFHEALVCEK